MRAEKTELTLLETAAGSTSWYTLQANNFGIECRVALNAKDLHKVLVKLRERKDDMPKHLDDVCLDACKVWQNQPFPGFVTIRRETDQINPKDSYVCLTGEQVRELLEYFRGTLI